MGRSLKILLMFLIGLLMVQTTGLTAEDSEVILFSQVSSNRETLYVAHSDGNNLRSIVSGKTITVFPEQKHLLYVIDSRLYEYDLISHQIKEWARFEESTIQVSVLPDGPDQAFIVGFTEFDLHFYVLDFSDGDLRKVSAPSGFKTSGNNRKLTVVSPDNRSVATVRSGSGSHFGLSVETQNKRKWEMPRDLTVLPEAPIWSFDSQKLAFYAMPFTGYEGFYSLYIVDLSQADIVLRKVQEDVFSTYFYSNLRYDGFKPGWSDNSNYLTFSYLPFGLPTESSIISFNMETGKKEILLNNLSENSYPQLSNDRERLLFLSDRDSNIFQVYLANLKQKDVKRVAPSEGYTKWAQWYRPGK